METEPPLWGKQNNVPREQGRPETAAVVCPWDGGPEEHYILEFCAWGRSEYKPKLCFKEEKSIQLHMLQKKGNLIPLMDESERVGDGRCGPGGNHKGSS